EHTLLKSKCKRLCAAGIAQINEVAVVQSPVGCAFEERREIDVAFQRRTECGIDVGPKRKGDQSHNHKGRAQPNSALSSEQALANFTGPHFCACHSINQAPSTPLQRRCSGSTHERKTSIFQCFWTAVVHAS